MARNGNDPFRVLSFRLVNRLFVQICKNTLTQRTWNMKKGLLLGFMLVLMTVATSFGALTVDQQAAVDGISTAVTDWIAVAWTIFLAATGGAAGLALAKKFIFRAM